MSVRIGALLMLAVAAAFIISLLVPWTVLGGLVEEQPELATAILIELRLPRAALALVYGATLGASGAAVQALFANPLASPDLTGTTSGAALGAVVVAYIIGFSSPIALSVGAVAAYCARVLQRGRRLSRDVAADRRRWMTTEQTNRR